MCLVEDVKSLKPVVACTLIPMEGAVIYTQTKKIKAAREAMLEFILINHPLDCPICCQGGECDLQDLTEIVGTDRGRFYESKRAVLNKNLGPLIKTLMNRCIHCTRCVRFSIEVSGISTLGILGRGGKMEIGTYLESFIDSEFSGNLADICPVGALTSKPYSFKARPWELEGFILLNMFDVFLTNIRIDVRGNNILRILPVYNTMFSNEWLADDVRYSYDSLYKQRLLNPSILINKFLVFQS